MIEIALIMVFCVGLAFVYRKASWQTPQSSSADQQTLQSYERRQSIFVNGAELAFFKALERHKPIGFYVFSKVRLEDILQVRRSIKDRKKYWQYRGRIKSRHVDFVLCNGAGQFLCAVELDGSSHNSRQTKMTDSFKDGIFAHAGLPLYRIQTGENFARQAVNVWAEIN